MIIGDCEWKLQIRFSEHLIISNNSNRNSSGSNNSNTSTCISTIWTSTSTATSITIAYETFTINFATSTDYHLQRVAVKVGGHFLSPRCFSLSKGRWLNHLEPQGHSVSVGVWCV
jgi:hypothetical protein